MNKLMLIIQREFSTRVRKKSFIILTILMPFLFAALIVVPVWLAGLNDSERKTVAVCDRTGQYIGLFMPTPQYTFASVDDPDNPAYYSDTTRYEAVVSISGDLVSNPQAVSIYSNKEVAPALYSLISNVLNDKVRKDKLAATGIEGIDRIMQNVQNELSIPTIKRTADGKRSTMSSDVATAAGFLFTFLIYMFVLMYGGMVMQSVMEEKTNRIVELMVSSVKPFQLMMGKITGIALVGFVQLVIWGALLAIILWGTASFFDFTPGQTQQVLATSQIGGVPIYETAVQDSSKTILNAVFNLPFLEIGLCFVLYFVGGYVLFASFAAAIGASVNEQEDSSQFMLPVILIMVFGLYAAMASVENPHGPLAFWASIIPITSPIVMMVRLPFSVPLWQELLSLVLLYLTAFGCVWGSGRIYRVGILMYGKKPNLAELWKWMRYK